ncbi:MAG: DUF2726 domain-containing protein, partial [Hyphomonadaceae bacterium]|nr:DUF2726 domain-containing protein [Clostridia bacterium]
ILNIIANAIINDKTVAVVSNNNSATANVLEKLQKYEVDFIAAYLGNNDNKDKFFAQQQSIYPDMRQWQLSQAECQTIQTNLKTVQEKLNDMLALQNRQALLKQALAQLHTEQAYFLKYYSSLTDLSLRLRSFFNLDADDILTMMFEYMQAIRKGSIKFRTKLYNLLMHGIYNFSFYNNNPEAIISFLQKTYYMKKYQEIKKEIDKIAVTLDDFNFKSAMKEYSENSMKLFRANLSKRYGTNVSRPLFTNDALWKSFGAFSKEYPVILSTTHSLRNCASENYLFDYVIVDEASQVDLATGALALSCAKSAVIVGDLKQLPNVVSDEVASATKKMFQTYTLDMAYCYADQSLLSSVVALYKDIPRTLLKEHYRCHPKIIGFCNQKFYHNELVILTEAKDMDKPLVVYITAKGNHARGNFNQRQIDVIFEEIMPEQAIDVTKQSVGIISPFRLQTNEIQKVIGTRNIEADTVHKYQGREKDVIVLTTVANEIAVDDFADNANLINVAVSRAVDKLIVVVSEGCEQTIGTNIGDLVRYIKYHNFEIIESQIYSVFDLLYSRYSTKLLDVIKSGKIISEYKSENLMNTIIEGVLSKPEFGSFERVIHQPLKMLIKDTSKLNDEECRFAMNILTHTDFVIFNKLDKTPILVVEVDGYAYHANNPKQLKRDKLKDGILKKYDIPILRLKTNESGEENRLKQKLADVLRL